MTDFLKIQQDIAYHADIVIDVNQVLLTSIDNAHPTLKEDLRKIEEASLKLKSIITELNQSHHLRPSSKENKNFWSKMRHQLRTPVNSIKGYSEIVIEDMQILYSQSALVEHMQEVLAAAEHILDLIDDLIIEDHIESRVSSTLNTNSDVIAINYVGSKILIIDDNVNNCEVLSRRLMRDGLNVSVAHSGQEGLNKVQQYTYDLILLDLIMPDINGLDVLKIIKADKTKPFLPVIMISAVTDIENIVQSIEAGAEDYLSKPFNPVILRARINASLEKKSFHDREAAFIDQLNLSRAALTTAIETIQDGFALFNPQQELTIANRKFREIYAVDEDIDHLTYQDFLKNNLQNNLYVLDILEDSTRWLEKRLDKNHQQDRIMEQFSDGRWIEISQYTMPDGGVVSIHKDITQSQLKEQQLSYQATHDALTGLANRVLFEQTLASTINTHEVCALMYCDLDGFKKVNDTFGHEFGDYLLTQVAHRLRQATREYDLVARLGGDEFAIILPKAGSIDIIEQIVDRIFQVVQQPCVRDTITATFGLSAGITFYPQDALTAEELVIRADTAMYTAKRRGKGQAVFYQNL